MSTLTENLQTIYEVKQEIKQVLGTSSDIFTEYPDLIEAAIAGGGGGLDWDEVASYGYIVPAGTLNMKTNQYYNVSAYAYANVQVAFPPDDGSNLITVPVDSVISEDISGNEMDGLPIGYTMVAPNNIVTWDYGVVINNFGGTITAVDSIQTQVYDYSYYTYWQPSSQFTAQLIGGESDPTVQFNNQFIDSHHALRFRMHCSYEYYDEFVEDTISGYCWTNWVRIVNKAGVDPTVGIMNVVMNKDGDQWTILPMEAYQDSSDTFVLPINFTDSNSTYSFYFCLLDSADSEVVDYHPTSGEDVNIIYHTSINDPGEASPESTEGLYILPSTPNGTIYYDNGHVWWVANS